MEIEGSAPVFPTEDPRKVKTAIENLFPGSEMIVHEDRIDFRTGSADEFEFLLEEQRIRDTAAMIIRRELADDATKFFLNKQAAFVGKVNFTEGSGSLGDISVNVRSGALEILAYITPG
jgi:predicted RNA binding protein with dsRBD fold (UPF0201 family)